MPGWTLATIRNFPTLTAAAKAEAAGFPAFSPSVLSWQRRPHGRGRVWVRQPAFQGYVLVAGDLAQLQRLQARFATWRVRPLAGPDAAWTEEAVAELRALEASWHEAARKPKPPRDRFQAGAEVVVVAGIFTGRRGLVAEDRGQQPVAVDLELDPRTAGRFGTPERRWRRVSMPASCLAAVAGPVVPGSLGDVARALAAE